MDTVIEFLNGRGGSSDAASVATYSVWIHGAEVRVEVFDHGAEERNRFAVYAKTVEEPEGGWEMNSRGESLGNPDADLSGALSNVHWNIF